MCGIDWKRFDEHRAIIHFVGNGVYSGVKDETLNETCYYRIGDMGHTSRDPVPVGAHVWTVFMTEKDYPENFNYKPPFKIRDAEKMVSDMKSRGELDEKAFFDDFVCVIEYTGNGWYKGFPRRSFDKVLPMKNSYGDAINAVPATHAMFAKVILTNGVVRPEWLLLPQRQMNEIADFLKV